MRAVVLKRVMSVQEDRPIKGELPQLAVDVVEAVSVQEGARNSSSDIPVAQVSTVACSSASHRCVIQNVPSTIDVLVKYSVEDDYKYVSMVLSPKTFHNSPLYCGLVSHSVQEAPTLLCGVVFPTFKEPLLLVLYEDAGEFERLRRMAKAQVVLDDDKFIIVGEISTLHGDIKYGRLEGGGQLQATSPNYEAGVEMRLVLDQPSGVGIKRVVIRLTLLAFGDHTWHPMEVSIVAAQMPSNGVEGQGQSVVAHCRNKSLIEYNNWSVDAFRIIKRAREVISAPEVEHLGAPNVPR